MTLGRYEVGPRVGGGGMAHVYVGRGVTDDGREELVALKVIRDEYGRDARHLRMFSDEAKILARLSHPNVIRTLEYGITRDHRFIAMELLAGRTLADLWDALVERGGRLSYRLGAWICAQVAAGLHAAHELTDEHGGPLSVIHRDVNPWNVFLTYAGEVKLIDFGLAKARVRRERSVDGLVKGKLAYLAPEQLRTGPIDRRVDIYALGTTLWEVGTLTRLFKRDTDVATLLAIREAHVPDPREVVSDYPDALHAVVDRALRRDREERHPDADALRRELDAFVLASDGDMRRELTLLLGELFRGEGAQHSSWRREAVSLRPLATMPPPPVPVPIASTHLLSATNATELDDADVELVLDEP
ncbi:MAG: serine/threonine protein kinase [Myxococcales bacterium]|nr:serine/threonine protein kinase [Myxococcales bacterium]